jgi:hypothetical protein
VLKVAIPLARLIDSGESMKAAASVKRLMTKSEPALAPLSAALLPSATFQRFEPLSDPRYCEPQQDR